ncbi:MAG TPA: hypothetical protein VD864_06915 [Nocardioides sp.]|nr:hypothetical protein [Nocardioides sp.]
MTTNAGPTERAQEAASTAADEGRHVAGTAKEEMQNVASTAAEQARNLVGEARSQVGSQLGEQATGQRDQVVSLLRSLGDDLESMAAQGPQSGLAADLVREVGDRARSLREHLDGREPGQILDDARDFARRRPGTFLLGALAAGVVAGRLVRGAADGTAAAAVAADRESTTLGSGVAAPAPPVTPATTAMPTPHPVAEPLGSGPGAVGASAPAYPPVPGGTSGSSTPGTPGGLS